MKENDEIRACTSNTKEAKSLRSSELKNGFKIGSWFIEPELNRVSSTEHDASSESTITPKVMSLCVLLAEKAGQPVSQGEIAQYVWPGVVISDSSIYQAIAQLRKALGDTEPQKKYIERVSGKGYRLMAAVELLQHAEKPQTSNQIKDSPLKSIDSDIKESTDTDTIEPNLEDVNSAEISSMAGNRIGSYIIAFSTLVIISLLVLGIKNSGKPSISSSQYKTKFTKIETLAILPTENYTQPKKVEWDSLSRLLLSDLLSVSDVDLILVREHHQDVDADAQLSHRISTSIDGLVLSAQIIRSNDSKVIWADDFLANNDGILGLKQQLTDALVAQLSKLNSSTQNIPTEHKTTKYDDRQNAWGSDLSRQQFESFILAGYLWNKREPEDLLKAKIIFKEILLERPDDVEILVGLCNTYLFLHVYSNWTKQQAYSQCAPLMSKAANISPDNGKVLATRALLVSDEDPVAAIELYKKSIKQTPNYADGYLWYGNLLRAMGNVELALEVHQKALSLDPLSPSINRSLAYSYLNLRQLELARQYYQRALAIEPEYSLRPIEELDFLPLNSDRARRFINWSENNKSNLGERAPYQLTQALVRLGLGQVSQAEILINKAQTGQVNTAFLLYTRAALHAAKGEMQQSRTLLEARYLKGVEKEQNSTRYVMPYLALLLQTGEHKQALNLFSKHFPEITEKAQVTQNNSGQFIFYYALLRANELRFEGEAINSLLQSHFNSIAAPQLTLSYIDWLQHQNRSKQVIAAIEKLMREKWLPDYNENILSEQFLEDAYLFAGGNRARFHLLIEQNRKTN